MEHQGEFVQLEPDTVFMITKHINTRFSQEQIEILIFLNNQNTHGGDCLRSPFFTKGAILAKRNVAICVKTLNTALFLVITMKPYFTIWMGISQGFDERWWAVPVQVAGANKGGNGVEGRTRRQ